MPLNAAENHVDGAAHTHSHFDKGKLDYSQPYLDDDKSKVDDLDVYIDVG